MWVLVTGGKGRARRGSIGEDLPSGDVSVRDISNVEILR